MSTTAGLASTPPATTEPSASVTASSMRHKPFFYKAAWDNADGATREARVPNWAIQALRSDRTGVARPLPIDKQPGPQRREGICFHTDVDKPGPENVTIQPTDH